MGDYDYDYRRLAGAIRDARNALHLTRSELAEHAKVSPGTIKNLEGGFPFTRWPKTMGRVEAALGKPEGWAREQALGKGDTSPPPPPLPAQDSGLPLDVQVALEDGRPLGAEVIDLSRPGSPLRLVVVARTGLYQTPEAREQLREQMEDWFKVSRELRRIAHDATSVKDNDTDE